MSDFDLAPKSSEKTIQDHLSNYYGLVAASQEFLISGLFDSYRLSQPSLHKFSNSAEFDVSTLNYSYSRLPENILTTQKIILGLSKDQFLSQNIGLNSWELTGSKARRRQYYYDHVTHTLAVVVNTYSDIDDFLNCLVSFQIERQKFSQISPPDLDKIINNEDFEVLGISEADWQRLKNLFGSNWQDTFPKFHQYQDLTIRSLPYSEDLIMAVVTKWWQKLSTSCLIFNFDSLPLYFISSNLHSLANVIGGYVNQRQDYIINHIEKNYPSLYSEWLEIKNGSNSLRVIDFLYYISGKYFKDLPDELLKKRLFEESLGIKHLKISSDIPCEAQLIPLSAIAKSQFRDPNLKLLNPEKILSSQTYILNIEYPLGCSAYYLLSHILKTHQSLKGVYIIGKAAILNGEIGDVQVPGIVFDERTNNVFQPQNIFNQYFPYPAFQSAILQNQKAVSVYGTFLENKTQLLNYTASGFNIIEMESGPYLNAILRHQQDWNAMPHDQIARIENLKFDFGIINYASDNPLSQTLGDGVMAIKGAEPTYLAVLTSLQRILDLESA